MVGSYLKKLDDALVGEGFTGRFHIVQSSGGVMSTVTARKLPVRTALSGPAAGVIAAAAIAEAAGYPDIITGDLGGTSFDVSLVAGGKTALAAQTTIDFGLVIRTPMIEITTIGAGGGSIAYVDAGGMLQVGPESAGSRPGPVAYGQGNTRPTLTDANIVLGRINAERPIGGKLARLDVEAAKAAIDTHVAKPLGLGVMEAAEAIVRIADGRMAGAIRLVSIERGHDPATSPPCPSVAAARSMRARSSRTWASRRRWCRAIRASPRRSAASSPTSGHDQVQTVNLTVDALDPVALDARMVEEAAAARAVVEAAGLAVDRIDTVFELDMHYVGQTHTVSVPLPSRWRTAPRASTGRPSRPLSMPPIRPPSAACCPACRPRS